MALTTDAFQRFVASQDHESFGIYTSGPSYLVSRMGLSHFRVTTVNGTCNEIHSGDDWRLETSHGGVVFELYMGAQRVFSTDVSGVEGLNKYLGQVS